MDAQKVDMFMMAHGSKFESFDIDRVREFLEDLPDEYWPQIQSIEFKPPLLMLLVSLLGGQLGIDRFILGETGLGVAKLLTCGGLGIWTIVDLFLVQDNTKKRNLELLLQSF